MKKFIMFLLGVLIVIGVAGCGMLNGWNGDSVFHLNTQNGEQKFDVKIADTFSDRRTGLMHVDSMPENAGMLFVFEESRVESFWMKNTLIPLDIIYMDSHYRIVHIVKDVQPCNVDKCPSFSSVYPVKYVLEINGGLCDKLGIDVSNVGYLDV